VREQQVVAAVGCPADRDGTSGSKRSGHQGGSSSLLPELPPSSNRRHERNEAKAIEEVRNVVDYMLARLGIQDKGQSLAEYALILALIAVVAIGALTLLGGQVTNILEQITAGLSV
jgi:pilus assembly protein Flp/PilA